MTKEVKFNSKSLLDIKFEKDVKGYNALQVDKTLDEVIEDYKIFEKDVLLSKNEIAQLKENIEILKKKVRELELDNAKAKNDLKSASISNQQSDNLSLLKRIDILERALWKKGVDPKKL